MFLVYRFRFFDNFVKEFGYMTHSGSQNIMVQPQYFGTQRVSYSHNCDGDGDDDDVHVCAAKLPYETP